MYEIDRRKFGAFVAQLRKERGMTQKELAEKLYISDKAVSKWETGVSVPDVALLIPLSEILGVTVTELLQSQRIPRAEPMASEQVEELVKTAIAYSDDAPRQASGIGKRVAVFLLCCLAACAECAVLIGLGYRGFSEMLQCVLVLCPLFGFYFVVLARQKLPRYYDDYRINGMVDGLFRMNIPGIRFNNHNWPRIIRTGRIWAMTMLVAYPAISILMLECFPAFWLQYETYIGLTLMLGGLFIPVIVVGRKYE